MPTTADMLAFEEAWPRWTGRKDEAIRARFHLKPARYLQLLHRAIDTIEAEQLDPLLVHRLRRERDRHTADQHRRLAG